MKQDRKRLTYANAMSTLAVFLVLGGATAFAASQLGKGSVGSRQLKRGSVSAAKLRAGAVTRAKLRDGAVSGAKVDESTLTQVPSAATAATATSAGSAAVAARVNGVAIGRILERSLGGVEEREVFANGHLRVTFSCDAGGNIAVRAFTASDHASIESYGPGADTDDSDFNLAENPKTISSGDEQRDLVFSDEGGDLVHLSYLAEELRPAGPRCVLAGFAESQ